MAELTNKEKQLEKVERLQGLWLDRMEQLFEDKAITSTDMATLLRFFEHNGWNVDPSRLPKGLRDKLTAQFDAEELDHDGDILPIRARA